MDDPIGSLMSWTTDDGPTDKPPHYTTFLHAVLGDNNTKFNSGVALLNSTVTLF